MADDAVVTAELVTVEHGFAPAAGRNHELTLQVGDEVSVLAKRTCEAGHLILLEALCPGETGSGGDSALGARAARTSVSFFVPATAIPPSRQRGRTGSYAGLCVFVV